jgi:drug/metabolite transporter (DMT)-like permease
MKLKGSLLMAFSAIGYGFTPIFLKMAYAEGATMLQVQVWRFMIAALFLWGICLPVGVMRNITLGDLPNLLLVGIGGGILFAGICIPQFSSMMFLSASISEVLYFTYPVWVALISSFITKIRLRGVQWALLILLLISIATTLDFRGNSFHGFGVFLALLASAFSASYILFFKRQVFLKYTGLQMGLCVMTGALVIFFLCHLLFESQSIRLPGNSLITVMAMAIVSTLIAMGSYFIGIKHIEPIEIAALSAIEPVVTIIAETFILGVNLGTYTYIGVFMMIVSITVFIMVSLRK